MAMTIVIAASRDGGSCDIVVVVVVVMTTIMAQVRETMNRTSIPPNMCEQKRSQKEKGERQNKNHAMQILRKSNNING